MRAFAVLLLLLFVAYGDDGGVCSATDADQSCREIDTETETGKQGKEEAEKGASQEGEEEAGSDPPILVVFENDTPHQVDILWEKMQERRVVFFNDRDIPIQITWQGVKYEIIQPGEHRAYNTHENVWWSLNAVSGETIRALEIQSELYELLETVSGNPLPDEERFFNNQQEAERSIGIVPPGGQLAQNTWLGSVWRFEEVLEGGEVRRAFRRMTLRRSAGRVEPSIGALVYTVSGRHPYDQNWRQIYPRQPVSSPMRSAIYTGDVILQFAFSKPWLPGDLLGEYYQMQMVVESVSPRVFRIPGFVSDEEADEVMRLCKPLLFQSTTGSSGAISMAKDRKSKTCFLNPENYMVVNQIAGRAYDVLNITKEQGRASCEEMQVVKYEIGGEYRAHHDYFDPLTAQAALDPEVQSGSNRFATVMFVLNAPTDGGATSFPRATVGGRALSFAPVKGQGLLWYHVTPDGNLDPLSLHQGDPVYAGDKWIATFFCWDRVK